VIALKRIVAELAVADFEATFEWAAGARSPSGVPGSVNIPHASSELLEARAGTTGPKHCPTGVSD